MELCCMEWPWNRAAWNGRGTVLHGMAMELCSIEWPWNCAAWNGHGIVLHGMAVERCCMEWPWNRDAWNGLTPLDSFTKLQKAIVSFVMSVCLSVDMEQLGSHWTDFHEI